MKNNKVSGVRKAVVAAIVVAGTAWSGLASAGALALTVDGTSNGFTLSTFASGFSTSSPYSAAIGPVGVAQLANGDIVVKNYADTSNYVFHDVDGQVASGPSSTYLSKVNVGGYNGTGMATLNGVTYTINASSQTINVVNSNGTLGAVISSVPNYNGLAANAADNSLYVGGPNGVYRIDLGNPDPNTNKTLFASGYFMDGITVSPDGKTVYVTDLSTYVIRGYDVATHTQNYTSPYLGAFGPDGVGVITGGVLSGQLVVNNNNGTVVLINPTIPNSLTVIANGGDRGDIVGFDTNNGTLFLTMGSYVYRLGLTAATIGGGGGGTGVPEPATLGLLGLGLAGALVTRLRRRG